MLSEQLFAQTRAMPIATQYCTKSSETRLAERVGSLCASSGERWTVEQMHELACAIVAAGDTFYVRRLLQRLERGEVDMSRVLRELRTTPNREASPPRSVPAR